VQPRDLGRVIAPDLRAFGCIAKLEKLIAAALATGDVHSTRSRSLAARSAGVPFDRARVAKFSLLIEHLLSVSPGGVIDLAADEIR
jgi:hypothetical protein